MAEKTIIQNQRARFGLPRGVAYLNCAYLSPALDAVRQAGEIGATKKDRPWEVLPDHFFEESDKLRAAFARVIGADTGAVALVP